MSALISMFITLADFLRGVFLGRKPRLLAQHDDWFDTVQLPGSKDYFGGKGALGAPLQVPCLIQNRGSGAAFNARYCAFVPKGVGGVLNDVWYTSGEFELGPHSEPLQIYLRLSNEQWVRDVLSDLRYEADGIVEGAVCMDGRKRAYRFLAGRKPRVWNLSDRLMRVPRPLWAQWQ
jgi:hypothetical protein